MNKAINGQQDALSNDTVKSAVTVLVAVEPKIYSEMTHFTTVTRLGHTRKSSLTVKVVRTECNNYVRNLLA